MKRIQSLILALAMLASLISAAPVSAETAGLTLEEGYELVDTAYSSEYGYIVAAKDYTKNTNGNPLPVKLYHSDDGISWEMVMDNTGAYNNANKYSRQQLVWWQEAGIFVLSRGNDTVYSKDGKTWSAVSSNAVRTNSMIEAEGDTLMSSGGRAGRYPTVSNYMGSVQHYCFAPSTPSNTYYAAAVGMTPKDEDGNRFYLSITTNKQGWLHSSSLCSGTTIELADNNLVTRMAASAFTSVPVDLKYARSIDGWIAIDTTASIYTIKTTGSVARVNPLGDDTGVTAVEVNGNTAIIGTSDGKLYSADITEGLDASSAWTEVTGSGMTDEVRSISAAGNGTYIAATKSAVFEIKDNNGTLTYDVFKEAVEEKLEIGLPYIDGAANAFEGTWLLGGAYSGKLNTYIAYGNTVSPSEGDYGRIYTSEDGVKWTLALKSSVVFNNNSTNAAVWWDKAIENEDGTYTGAFIVSCATNSGAANSTAKGAWYSSDGKEWRFTEALWLCADGDIAVSGDYLYTLDSETTNNSNIKKISAMKINQEDGTVTADVEKITYERAALYGANSIGRKLAVSNDQNNFMIGTSGSLAMQWDNSAKAAYESGTNQSAAIMDMAYDEELGYFVAVHGFESAVYGIWNGGRPLTWKPFTADGPKMISFAKQNDKYAFGRVDGGIYITDKALSTSSVMTEVTAEEGRAANTIRVKDMIAGADGKVLAIAAGTNINTPESDALLIDLESATYKKANDNVNATANAGDVLKVGIPYVNTTNKALSAVMITAVYKDGVLVQAAAEETTLSYSEDGLLEQELTVNGDAPEACTVKVMLWDDEQTPYTTVTTPVFN